MSETTIPNQSGYSALVQQKCVTGDTNALQTRSQFLLFLNMKMQREGKRKGHMIMHMPNNHIIMYF